MFKWGWGIGDWGLGIGDWAQSPIPNPQSPIPNPHKIIHKNFIRNKNNKYIYYKLNLSKKKYSPKYFILNI